jgi:hypothetical protein
MKHSSILLCIFFLFSSTCYSQTPYRTDSLIASINVMGECKGAFKKDCFYNSNDIDQIGEPFYCVYSELVVKLKTGTRCRVRVKLETGNTPSVNKKIILYSNDLEENLIKIYATKRTNKKGFAILKFKWNAKELIYSFNYGINRGIKSNHMFYSYPRQRPSDI